MALIPETSAYPERTAPTSDTPGRRPLGHYRPLAAIRDTLARNLPTDATGYVRPRGLLVPLDPWMRGVARFALKVGGQGSVWRPDIYLTLTEDACQGTRALSVTRVPGSTVEETLIQLSPTQREPLINITDTSVTLGADLIATIAAGTRLRLFAFPVSIEEPKTLGSSHVRIASPHYLTPGDVLELPIAVAGYTRTVKMRIETCDLVETDVQGYKYEIVLTTPFPRALEANEIAYIHVYPAYFSGRVALPRYGTPVLRVNGPFLIDFASGSLARETRFEEQSTYRLYRSDRSPITSWLSGVHNVQAGAANIRADQLLFWDVITGSLSFAGSHAYATTDSNGHFRLVTRFAPYFVPQDTHAYGTITAAAASEFLDYETVTVHDGIMTAVFEFRVSDGMVPTPGLGSIDLRYVSTREQVAGVISAAISAWRTVGLALDLDVETVGYETRLTARTGGMAANIPTTDTVTSTLFRVEGLVGGGGGVRWVVTLSSPVPLPPGSPRPPLPAMRVYATFHPNSDLPVASIPAGTFDTSFTIEMSAGDQPARALDLRIVSDPGTVVCIHELFAQGSTTAFIEHNTVVRLETDAWAGGCLFAKPLWPSFDLLRPDPRGEPMNSMALLL